MAIKLILEAKNLFLSFISFLSLEQMKPLMASLAVSIVASKSSGAFCEMVGANLRYSIVCKVGALKSKVQSFHVKAPTT